MATDESASAAAEVPFCLRPAEPLDLAGIVELIRGLAEYERLTHLLEVTPEKLQPHLFGPRPAAEVLVAELRGEGAETGRAHETSEADSTHATHPTGATSARGATACAAAPELAAFALYFTSFSTFLARPGLYLEDLYVRPAQRGRGIGRALLTRLGRIAVERGHGRFEWSVLDWNESAIRFYEKMGATVLPEWRLCRITGDALQAFRA